MFTLVIFISIQNGIAFAEMVAVTMPSAALASLAHSVGLVAWLLTCGFLGTMHRRPCERAADEWVLVAATEEVIPQGWRWLYQVNLFRMPLSYLAQNEYAGLAFTCDRSQEIPTPA